MPSENHGIDSDIKAALQSLRKRLLDLTGRNRLISFRHTKGASLRVIDEMPDQLADTLLGDKEMRFLAVPEPKKDQLIEAGYITIDDETGQEKRLKKDPSAEEWARWLGLETSYEVPVPSNNHEARHTDKEIQTLLFPYEMETRLHNLQKKSKLAIEETGNNILYLAFGFLEWFESAESEKPRIAPLFLIPVNLQKGKLNPSTKTYVYTLKYSGEDILPNLSLREKLRVDFGLALPDLDENSNPEAYFKEVQNLIRENQPRWKVRRYITLTLLNFSKLLMYLDLDPDRWPEGMSITEHPVVMRILTRFNNQENESGTEPDLGFAEEHLIDEIPDIHEKYPLIDDADSSQHSALVDALEGKNLVIEGPPGTGKSQTITNLIAAAMAQGKKVLFVAEKLAALEVVKCRLDAASLGEFCLELHSHKSHKRKVLDDIGKRLKNRGHGHQPGRNWQETQNNIDADIARYEELKNTLKNHAGRINRSWKNTGKTLHEIFMGATRFREALDINPELLHPEGYNGDVFDGRVQRQTRDQVLEFGDVCRPVKQLLDGDNSLRKHPWYGVSNCDLLLFDTDAVLETLANWNDSLNELVGLRTILAEGLSCNESEIPNNLGDLALLLEDLQRLPILKGDELLDTLPVLKGDVIEKLNRYLKLFDDIQSFYKSLSATVGREILQDLSAVNAFLEGNKQLQNLVGGEVDLATLTEAIKSTGKLAEQLNEIVKPVDEIIAEIGAEAGKHLGLHESGLKELKLFVETVAALKPVYWNIRSDIFDNDELDQVLPQIRLQLEKLHFLKTKIEETYSINGLPEPDVLQGLLLKIELGGFFRWFKSSWRTARNQLLGYAANPKVKFKALLTDLDKAISFEQNKQNLKNDQLINNLLGDFAQGLDTDISSLEALRAWYRHVRKVYGIGFGPKVALGNSIINLRPGLAKAVRSWAEQGIGDHLGRFITQQSHLKRIFQPVTDLQGGNVPLVGDSGILSRLKSELEKALQACDPLIGSANISLAELGKRIKKLDVLRKAVDNWRKADFDKKLFQGRLSLKPGLDFNNSNGLSSARNTLSVAECLNNRFNSNLIIDCIYKAPEEPTFKSLNNIEERLKNALNEENKKTSAFQEIVQLDLSGWIAECGDNLINLIKRNTYALDHQNTLQNWLDYVRVREPLLKMGFDRLVDAVERNTISIKQIEDGYFAGIYDVLAREIFHEQPELARFSGHSQQSLQKQFKEYDENLMSLQCERIAWKINQALIPRGSFGGPVGNYTERSLIEHECGKKRRHIPIRQLIKRSSVTLQNLKPCFMMGPLSVAQYLGPGQVNFDLVVMDEASQIKPEDAIGAVARGGQLIVVGDQKQLPPTNFFDKLVDIDEEDLTGIEESESILDTVRTIFSARRLRWHYRSQHESLIAFSNQNFYENDLVLFPSPHSKSEDYGIQYSKVHRGCFVNRRNLEESKIISEAVREHFRNRPEETLGVVAMNAEQRDQIERSVEMLAKEDISFQEWLEKDQNRQESLFIKNLENVQGDERDVIFISMTYGPQDIGGNVFQRFGPINLDTGWRRLNVLFTRSRRRMHIFTSLSSTDIVIGPNSRRGVTALRDFLAYGETGILHNTEVASGRAPDSDFEVAVSKLLELEGFKCTPQVGVAGFFIDLAVIDPGNPGRYLMGIECDGATYHSAKSVRDRDRLRQKILERLGWRMRRIWSTDWFKDPHGELQPIIRELSELRSEPCIEREIESETEEIEEIIDEVETPEATVDRFISEQVELKEKLVDFDNEIIQKEQPNTLENKRLLRPAMLEALLEYLPTNKWEFLEKIPPYLRQSTEPEEGKYLARILEIINSSMGRV